MAKRLLLLGMGFSMTLDNHKSLDLSFYRGPPRGCVFCWGNPLWFVFDLRAFWDVPPKKKEAHTETLAPVVWVCLGFEQTARTRTLSEACRKSGIMALDVDVVECHGSGRFIADAVEERSGLRIGSDPSAGVTGLVRTEN